MTQIFDENGLAIPVTVIKVDDIVVTQVKTVETDGYNAIQVATGEVKERQESEIPKILQLIFKARDEEDYLNFINMIEMVIQMLKQSLLKSIPIGVR